MNVFITGYGVITAYGNTEATWQAALAAGSQARPLGERFGDLQNRMALSIDDKVLEVPLLVHLGGADRAAKLCVIAADDALKMSGLDDVHLSQAGVFIGSSRSTETTRDLLAEMIRKGEELPKDACTRSFFASPSVTIASAFGCKGPNATLSATCASSAAALIDAYNSIKAGDCDTAIVGGTESCLTYGYLRQTDTLGIMTSSLCRPFDAQRDGTWFGESSGILVLESYEHAKRRHAPVFAEILATSSGCDGTAFANRSGVLERVVHRALEKSGVRIDEIDYINAHAPGTRVGDALESYALYAVLGDRLRDIPVNSFKPVIGHCIGASGAVETVLCLEQMRRGIVAPTTNLSEPDPSLPIYAPRQALSKDVRTVLKVSSGLGGIHAAYILKKIG